MTRKRGIAKRGLGCTALVLLACCWAISARATDQPLGMDDVRMLLIGGTSPQKMISLIDQRGIDFRMNPDLAKKFHDDGATDEVIEALQKAGERVAARSAPPSSQPSNPVPNASPPPAAVNATSAPQAEPPSGHAPLPPPSVEQKISDTLAGAESRLKEPDLPLAPTFALKDLEGRKLDLKDYRGQVVLLDFWASWCGPCRREIPAFVELQERYRSQGFRVIGVSIDDTSRRVQNFYEQYRMNYRVAMGDSQVRNLYGGVHALPTTLLIGRDGRIYAKVTGSPADLTAFESRIKMLLERPFTQLAELKPTPPPVSGKQVMERAPAAAPQAAAPPPSAAPSPQSVPQPSNSSRGNSSAHPDLSDPSPDQVQKIIQTFTAKEKLFKEARNNYTYHQINKVETLDADGNVDGEFEQDWDILYDDNGGRIERVTYAPPDTLTRVGMTREDMDAMRNIQPFVLTSDELPEYELKYLGHVKVDEITAYVFSIRPKEIKKGKQYFQGVVWVDDQDLQIVKSEGKQVPELRSKHGENLFPRFTTYREQIDGKYWFPTYTMADDTLYFGTGPVHIKEIIRYTDYKQFKSKVRIIQVSPTDQPPPAPPSKPPR